MKKSPEMKKLLVMITVVLLLFITIINVLSLRAYRKMESDYYEALSVLLSEIKEQYPEFKEEDWIQYLSESHGEDNDFKESDILDKYGYYQKETVIQDQQKQFQKLMVVSNVLFACTMGLAGFLLFHYWKKRRNAINTLAEYIRRIEQGEYALDLVDNTEDELSTLKNELYTVTVMLKENAELSSKQKKALARSVSDISHQIKTPLTSVMVLLDNLTDDEDMPTETRSRFLTEVSKQCNHVSWLVASLLRLSRLDAGVVEFSKTQVSIKEILEQVKNKLEILAELKQIDIVTEGEDISLVVDKNWFAEALLNIVKNAIEHSTEKSKVIIRLKENDVYASILVKDFGEGMDEEDCKHIFERFYKSKNASEQSIGIGLSLAWEVVKQHNGTISVNAKPGKGTEFEIKIYKVL